MAIGYADKNSLLNHEGHKLEVAVYGQNYSDENKPYIDSVTIECIDCGEVLIDTEETYGDE